MSDNKKIYKSQHILTPMSTNCRLCHFAGFSNLCTFSLGGECPYVTLKKSLAKETNQVRN